MPIRAEMGRSRREMMTTDIEIEIDDALLQSAMKALGS